MGRRSLLKRVLKIDLQLRSMDEPYYQSLS